MRQPFFTVLMPAYNAAAHISGALGDLLTQTFRDFEIVVVDDGSTDRTSEVARKFSDPRIRLFQLPENAGLVAALNAGLAEARGEWIARQDADDRCRRDRLARQHAAILSHPHAILHYSRATLINQYGWWRGTLRPPTDDAGLRWDLCFRNAVPHTSAVFPTKLVRDRGYAGDNVTADYELWSCLLREGAALGDSTCLVSYRNHPASIMGQANVAVAHKTGQDLRSIALRNLCEWARASEEEANAVTETWNNPAHANWERYFAVREKLARCELAPGAGLIAEEDYTLMHRAFGVSRACGRAMLDALHEIAPHRCACLPQPRTAISQLLASFR